MVLDLDTDGFVASAMLDIKASRFCSTHDGIDFDHCFLWRGSSLTPFLLLNLIRAQNLIGIIFELRF